MEDRITDGMQESEFIEVPVDLKRYVIGKHGCVITEIRQNSGALVDPLTKADEGFLVSGDEEQRACAKRLILEEVVSLKKIRLEFIYVKTYSWKL